MIIGHLLMGSSGKYYGPWFARGGNSAVFHVVLQAVGASTDFKVTIQHKNNGDADPSAATVVATFSTMTAAGQEDIRGTNLKQLVRYQYEVSGAGDFRHAQFDVPEPSWEAN